MRSETPDPRLAREIVNTIRFLAVDAVEEANSGHPGMPMGAADIAFVVWSRYLRYDPGAPEWPDRDRFVLSAGHGSMLLYSLLHLAGYDLPMSEIRAFRQWGSRTPGHPESGLTPGVETTTGPLGQGVGNAVGMALGAGMLASRFNGSGTSLVDHRVFCIASDGDLMEGVSGEASSLAGHLGLGNLVVLYDDNRITIEGGTDLTYTENAVRRYEGYGWHVAEVDGHDHEKIAAAIDEALGETGRPSLIRCRTHIAFGSPGKQDTADSHGAPLGADEVAATKAAQGWPDEPRFHVPDGVRGFFRGRAEAGLALRTAWDDRFAAWKKANPDLAGEWERMWNGGVPEGITRLLVDAAPTDDGATRAHGGAVLQKAAALVPNLVGGSADLAPSTKTIIKASDSVGPGALDGRNLHFGIREHGMGAMMNGMLWYGAWRPYGATFLVFSDYMRPSVRVAALAHLPAIYVFTHDSIFVGEDGPTHEPIEHAWALRVIPNLRVFRPADGIETALAWGMALERRDGPTAILLTRQKVPALPRDPGVGLDEMRRGAYIVADGDGPDAVVAATGSEVHLALAAREGLAAEGKRLRVVSVPCLEAFLAEGDGYREKLFPRGVPVATVEAGRTDPWRVLAGVDGLTIGIDHFGASAPATVLAEKFGFTAESVTDRIRAWIR
jgi:transketolase